jgi:endoglucanase
MQLLSLLAAASALGLAFAAPSKLAKRAGKMQWVGVNESGPEFGDGIFPGRYGTEFIWPTLSTYDTFIARGFNTFRINFYMERLIPDKLTGTPDAGYLRNLTEQVNYVTSKGAYAMIQPHNYGRYYSGFAVQGQQQGDLGHQQRVQHYVHTTRCRPEPGGD